MLLIEDLCVSYPGAPAARAQAVDRLSLHAREGRILALLGPSGCGKSTTLRAIAGLLRPRQGRIRFGEQTFFCHASGTESPAARRNIGFMFQSYAIWPHMTVLENAAFPLTVRRPRAGRTRERAQALDILARLGLAELAERSATELSGGQQQRLALARALVHRPQLLLLDEPLSNVEPGLRTAMVDELRELQRETGVTMVLVTHDHTEALSLADEIAIMRDGRLQQQDSPEAIYRQPCNAFVAGFVGQINLLPGVGGRLPGAEAPAGLAVHASPIGPLLLAHPPAGAAAALQDAGFTVGIRPESVRVHSSAPPQDTPNVFAGSVRATAFLGDRLEVHATLAGRPIVARLDARQPVAAGAPVWLELPPAHCLRFAQTD